MGLREGFLRVARGLPEGFEGSAPLNSLATFSEVLPTPPYTYNQCILSPLDWNGEGEIKQEVAIVTPPVFSGNEDSFPQPNIPGQYISFHL